MTEILRRSIGSRGYLKGHQLVHCLPVPAGTENIKLTFSQLSQHPGYWTEASESAGPVTAKARLSGANSKQVFSFVTLPEETLAPGLPEERTLIDIDDLRFQRNPSDPFDYLARAHFHASPWVAMIEIARIIGTIHSPRHRWMPVGAECLPALVSPQERDGAIEIRHLRYKGDMFVQQIMIDGVPAGTATMARLPPVG